MKTRKWTTTRKRPTAAEQRTLAREKALEQCSKGYHTHTPSFRPSELVCTICGMVVYCPDCLNHCQLLPLVHAYPVTCSHHRSIEAVR